MKNTFDPYCRGLSLFDTLCRPHAAKDPGPTHCCHEYQSRSKINYSKRLLQYAMRNNRRHQY